MELQDLNNRFDNSKLLLCVAFLNPNNSFFAFNKEKLIQLPRFYPNYFLTVQLTALDYQLETYIFDMQFDEEFSTLE